eukprot:g105.t1
MSENISLNANTAATAPAPAVVKPNKVKSKKKKKSKKGKKSSSNASVGNTKTIVKRLMELAADPASRSFIVKDGGCLKGLVAYLKHKNLEVHTIAAQTIYLLATSKENHATLCETEGLLANLLYLKKKKTKSPKAAQICQQTLATLQSHINGGETSTTGSTLPNESTQQTSESEKDATDTSVSSSVLGSVVIQQQNNSTGGLTEKTAASTSLQRKFKTHTLKVQGIANSEQRSIVERALIRVKGVVSVTMDKKRGKVTIVTRSAEEMQDALLCAVSGTGLTATPYVKTKKRSSIAGERARTKGYLDDSIEQAAAKSSSGIGYLDEDDDDEENDGIGVVSKFGSASLQSRLAAQREREERKREKERRAEGYVSKVGAAIGWGASWLGMA